MILNYKGKGQTVVPAQMSANFIAERKIYTTFEVVLVHIHGMLPTRTHMHIQTPFAPLSPLTVLCFAKLCCMYCIEFWPLATYTNT